MDTKHCPDCKTTKPAAEFPRNRQLKSGLHTYCRPCANARNAACKAKIDPAAAMERQARYDRKNKLKNYGLTEDRYVAMLEAQRGLCAICGSPPGRRDFDVDHDHACCPSEMRSCGKCVRGLLCSHCNRMLGYARDDAATMDKGAEYLRLAKSCESP